jgi:putative intracellular protease/amidase
MARVIVPVPDQDSDPSEVALCWKILVDRGHDVEFATESGTKANCDQLMLTGRGFDPWAIVPGLDQVALVGRLLGANKEARLAHERLLKDPRWNNPGRWEDIHWASVDGLLLPGGHRARGMRPYLESTVLQRLILQAFHDDVPVAAVCHGALLVARSIDPATRRSVLYGRKTTGLTWSFERKASVLTKIGRFWDSGYYRTYEENPGQAAGYMSVQAQISRALKHPQDFLDVPAHSRHAMRKGLGLLRDSVTDSRPAFVVRDGNYVSARWPGDVHTFAHAFAELLPERA